MYMGVPMYRYVHVCVGACVASFSYGVAFELHIQMRTDSNINAYYLARGSMYLCVFV